MEKLIAWVEIPSTDFERAVNFYAKIFQVEMEVMQGEDEKMAILPSGEGAVIWAKGYEPSKDGVLVSLNTGNQMDHIMEQIQNNGGSIITPKTKIQAEGKGYFAIFIDCEGNRMGLYGDQ